MGEYDDDCDWSHVTLNTAWRRKEWALALGGATLFVIVSKETVLYHRNYMKFIIKSTFFAILIVEVLTMKIFEKNIIYRLYYVEDLNSNESLFFAFM